MKKRSSRPGSSRVVIPPYCAPARSQALFTTSCSTPTKSGLRYGQEFDVPGVPEGRPVAQQEDTGQPDEPAPQTETVAAYRTTSGSDSAPGATRFWMAPMPSISKPGLPIPNHHPRRALPLRTECLRPQPRLLAAFTTDNLHLLPRGCQSTMNRSDWEKCSLISEQKTKAKYSFFTYRNTVGACDPFGAYPKRHGLPV